MLTDDEATSIYRDNGKHVNLCSYCRAMSKEDVLDMVEDETNFLDGVDTDFDNW
jgi:hypothetical protein